MSFRKDVCNIYLMMGKLYVKPRPPTFRTTSGQSPRGTTKMSRNTRAQKKAPPTPNIIDVDEFHKRYEDTNDLVQCSSAEEFRKAWRSTHKEKGGLERTRSESVAESPRSSRQSRGQQGGSSRAISTSTPGKDVAAGGQHLQQRVRQQLNKTAAKDDTRRSISREGDRELPSTQLARVVSKTCYLFVF